MDRDPTRRSGAPSDESPFGVPSDCTLIVPPSAQKAITAGVLAGRALLTEAEALPEVTRRVDAVNALMDKKDFEPAWKEAWELREFLVTRCAPSPAFKAKLDRIEGVLQTLNSCGYGPRKGGEPSPSGEGAGGGGPLRLVLMVGAVVVLLVLGWWLWTLL